MENVATVKSRDEHVALWISDHVRRICSEGEFAAQNAQFEREAVAMVGDQKFEHFGQMRFGRKGARGEFFGARRLHQAARDFVRIAHHVITDRRRKVRLFFRDFYLTFGII